MTRSWKMKIDLTQMWHRSDEAQNFTNSAVISSQCSLTSYNFGGAYFKFARPHFHRALLYHGLQESCAIAKMTAQCAIHGCPENFRESLTIRPRQLFATFSWAFVPIDPMNVPTKYEVRSFTCTWDNREYPRNLGSPWIRPRSIFSKIFNGLLFGLVL